MRKLAPFGVTLTIFLMAFLIGWGDDLSSYAFGTLFFILLGIAAGTAYLYGSSDE